MVTDYPKYPVMMVDDESCWLNTLECALNTHGITNTISCTDAQKVCQLLDQKPISVLLLDLNMPHVRGEKLLQQVVKNFPDVLVIIISCIEELDTVIKCIQTGAYDYCLKTNELNKMITTVKRAIELSELRNSYATLKSILFSNRIHHPEIFDNIITQDKQMIAIFQYIEAIAFTDHPVLITGETGVGKELIARAIHQASGRKGPFIAVNIASLDEETFNDTLFGHIKGAFTNANQHREGLVSKALDGTLFLDEIGELSVASQIKLLRLIQEKEYWPLGSDAPKSSNSRIICSTLIDINHRIASGGFRKDLFYRLSTHHICIPPLRERKDDIPLLLHFFIQQASKQFGKTSPPVPKELEKLILHYRFEGNVRELQSMVFDAVANYKSGWLSIQTFTNKIHQQHTDNLNQYIQNQRDMGKTLFSQMAYLPTLKDATHELIQEALIRNSFNKSMTAKMLGITRQALNWRLKQINL